MKLLTPRKKFKVRKKIERFSFLPIVYKGTLFWLSRIIIEKSFNGSSMQIINIQKK